MQTLTSVILPRPSVAPPLIDCCVYWQFHGHERYLCATETEQLSQRRCPKSHQCEPKREEIWQRFKHWVEPINFFSASHFMCENSSAQACKHVFTGWEAPVECETPHYERVYTAEFINKQWTHSWKIVIFHCRTGNDLIYMFWPQGLMEMKWR